MKSPPLKERLRKNPKRTTKYTPDKAQNYEYTVRKPDETDSDFTDEDL